MAYSTKAVEFDGSNDYATAGNVLAFERTQSFSVSLWFACKAGGGYMLGKMGGAPYYRGWGVAWAAGGSPSFVLRSHDGAFNRLVVHTVRTGLDDGKWHHIVWTYAGGSSAASVLCYVDSVPAPLVVDLDYLSDTIVSADPFWLGGAVAASAGWTYPGRLDEVAIYGKVLSEAEAVWIYNTRQPRSLRDSGCPNGLMAWWRMGDGDTFPTLLDSALALAWPTIPDSSGNNYNGTATNMEFADVTADAPRLSRSSKSVRFDGTNDYVTMGNVTAFLHTSSWSCSAWVKRTTSGGGRVILSKYTFDYPGKGWSFSLDASSGRLQFNISHNAGSDYHYKVTPVSAVPLNAWCHVCATYNGSNTSAGIKLYVNGVDVGGSEDDAGTGTDITTTNPLVMGCQGAPAASYFWLGNLDEVAIHDDVLTPAEVAWIYNGGAPVDLAAAGAPSNLRSWWYMGEGDTFPLLLDHGPGNYTGTMTNMAAPDIVTDAPVGGSYSTKCLNFGGVDEYVTAGNVLAFERTQAFSISMWVKFTGTNFLEVGKLVTGGIWNGWYFVAGAARTYLVLSSVNGSNMLYVQASATLNDGAWHHVAFSYSGNSLPAGVLFYVDGVAKTTVTNTSNLTGSIVTNAPLRFGTDGSSWCIGKLDEIAIYNKELSAAEIAWIYNVGIPRPLQDVGAPSNLVGWWRMGEDVALAYPATMTYMESTDFVNDGPNFEGYAFTPTIATFSAQQEDVHAQWYGDLEPIPPPPTPFVPVIDSWSPSPGTTITRDDAIAFNVTDADDNIARVVIVAEFPWGSEVVHGGDEGFSAGYAADSTRSAIAYGFAYSIVRDVGWGGPPLTISIYANDTTGQEATPTSYAFTVSDPVVPERNPPVVSDVEPEEGTAIARTDPIFFSVTDDSGAFRRIIVTATFADGTSEVVHDGDGFAARYGSTSTRTPITNGFRYRVRRTGGWPYGPTIRAFAIDPSGNENL